MPTYEYECEACGHTFEEWQSITSEALKKCPKCGKKKLKRLFGTGGAIIFKGSGFYETDYRSDSYKKGEKADSSNSSTSSASKESKDTTSSDSDSKPSTQESTPKPKGDSKPKSDKPKK